MDELSDRATPATADSAPVAHDPLQLLELARTTQRTRAKVADLLPRNLFRDSAWDLMLELFVATKEQRPICIKDLVIASGETTTSALRRIDGLEGADLLRRCDDPSDNRRVAIVLTEAGDAAMSLMLSHLFLDGVKPSEPDT